MPVLKLPESFGTVVERTFERAFILAGTNEVDDSVDTVRVHRRDDGIADTVILQLDTDCGFAEVEMRLEETTDLIAMLQEVLSYRETE